MSSAPSGAEYPRDRYGRALVRVERGAALVACTRPTTIAKALDDAEALTRWKVRTTAHGLALRPDLLALVAATAADEQAKVDDLCEAAKEAAAGSAGANTGSALHLFTADVDAGQTVTAPPPIDAALALYASTLSDAGVRVLPNMIERHVVLTDEAEPIAGTLDRIVSVGGQLYVADLKSGRNLAYSWLSISVQLAIYARAQYVYDVAAETLAPKPSVNTERALVVHLRHDPPSCSLHWVRIGDDAGWCFTRLALAVRAARRRKDLVSDFCRETSAHDCHGGPQTDGPVVGATNRPGQTAERVAWVRGRVVNLRDAYPRAFADLATMWPAGVPTLRTADAHTDAEVDRIAAALDLVEGGHRVPFGDPDPAVVHQQQTKQQHIQIGAHK